jgi:hypothetical protein
MRILVAVALTLATSISIAHGPTRQKVGLAHLKELLQNQRLKRT